MTSKKAPSTSSISRIGQTASLLFKLGKEELKQSVVQMVGNSTQIQKALENKRIKQATEVVKTLGEMKGAMMKLGQALANQLEGVLPEEFVKSLSALQSSAPPIDYSVLHKILLEDFGEAFFEQFKVDPIPLGSASIGQVHALYSAQSDSTLPIAVVKFRYPGIEKTIHLDMSLAETLFKPLEQFSSKNIRFKPVIEEIKRSLIEEVDYRIELKNLQFLRNLFNSKNDYYLPAPYPQYCNERILVMEYLPGHTLQTFKASMPEQEEIDRVGTLIYRLLFEEIIQLKTIQTDPNYGNFIFPKQPSKHLGLIDFGSVKYLQADFYKIYHQMALDLNQGNRQGFLAGAFALEFLSPQEDEETQEIFWQLIYLCAEPTRQDYFNFKNNDLLKRVEKFSWQFLRSVKHSSPPANVVLINRKIMGVFNILASLGCQAIPTKAIFHEYVKPKSQRD